MGGIKRRGDRLFVSPVRHLMTFGTKNQIRKQLSLSLSLHFVSSTEVDLLSIYTPKSEYKHSQTLLGLKQRTSAEYFQHHVSSYGIAINKVSLVSTPFSNIHCQLKQIDVVRLDCDAPSVKATSLPPKPRRRCPSPCL